jgi:hypothetical protein
MFKKKAVGLSVPTIIIAVIGLIVLVVLVGIFTGRLNLYSAGLGELTTCKSTCGNLGYGFGEDVTNTVCSDFEGFSPPGRFSDAGGATTQQLPDGRTINTQKKCCCFNSA